MDPAFLQQVAALAACSLELEPISDLHALLRTTLHKPGRCPRLLG